MADEYADYLAESGGGVSTDDGSDDSYDEYLRRQRQDLAAQQRRGARGRKPVGAGSPLAPPVAPEPGTATVTAGPPMPVQPVRIPRAMAPRDVGATAADVRGGGLEGLLRANTMVGRAESIPGVVGGAAAEFAADQIRHPAELAGWIVAPEVMTGVTAARLGTNISKASRGAPLDASGRPTEQPVSWTDVGLEAAGLLPVLPHAARSGARRFNAIASVSERMTLGAERSAAADARFPGALERAQQDAARSRAARQPGQPALPPGQYDMPAGDFSSREVPETRPERLLPSTRGTDQYATPAGPARGSAGEGPVGPAILQGETPWRRDLAQTKEQARASSEERAVRQLTRPQVQALPPSPEEVRGAEMAGVHGLGEPEPASSADVDRYRRMRDLGQGVPGRDIGKPRPLQGEEPGAFEDRVTRRVGDRESRLEREAMAGEDAPPPAAEGEADHFTDVRTKGGSLRPATQFGRVSQQALSDHMAELLDEKLGTQRGNVQQMYHDRLLAAEAELERRGIPTDEIWGDRLDQARERRSGKAGADAAVRDDLTRGGFSPVKPLALPIAAGGGAVAGSMVGDTPEERKRNAAMGAIAALGVAGLAIREPGAAPVAARGDRGARPGYVGDPTYLIGAREHPTAIPPEMLDQSRARADALKRPVDLAPAFDRSTKSPVLQAEERAAPLGVAGLKNRTGAVGDLSKLPEKPTKAGPAVEHASPYDDLPDEVAEKARRDARGPNFGERLYSRTGRAINAAPFEKGTAEQWKAHLSKNVSGSEREWTGLDDLLEQKKGQVLTRQQVADTYNKNRIRIKETVLGGDAPQNEPARFDRGDLKLPGGRNYREIILSHDRPQPTDADVLEEALAQAKKNGNRAAINGLQHVTDRLAEIRADGGDYDVRDLIKEAAAGDALSPREAAAAGSVFNEAQTALHPDRYTSSHWGGIDNPLAHVRLTDRTLPSGEQATVIEEIQSDWHQAGHRYGYKGVESPKEKAARAAYDAADQEYAAAGARMDAARDRLNSAHPGRLQTYLKAVRSDPDYLAAKADSDAALAKRDAAEKEIPSSGDSSSRVPNAPLKKTEEWQALGLKRAIDEAVRAGHDRVVWITGEQSADRYDLSRQVDQLQYVPESGLLLARQGGSLVHQGNYDPKALPDVVGKDVADRLLQSEAKKAGEDPRSKIKALEWEPVAHNESSFIAPVHGQEYYTVGPKDGATGEARYEVRHAEDGGNETFVKDALSLEDAKNRALEHLKETYPEKPAGPPTHELRGLDLKVGGEFHKFLYDRSLPQVVKDYAKKMGVKVEVEPVDLGLKGPEDLTWQHIRDARSLTGDARVRTALSGISGFLQESDGNTWREALESYFADGPGSEIREPVRGRVRRDTVRLLEKRATELGGPDGEYVARPDGPLGGNAGPEARVAGPDVDMAIEVAEGMEEDEPAKDGGRLVGILKKIQGKMNPEGGGFRTFGSVMRELPAADRADVEEFMEIKPWEPPTPSGKPNLSFKITPELAAKVKGEGQPLGFITPALLAGAGAPVVGAAAGAATGSTPEERRRNAAIGIGLGVGAAALVMGRTALKGRRAPDRVPATLVPGKVKGEVVGSISSKGGRRVGDLSPEPGPAVPPEDVDPEEFVKLAKFALDPSGEDRLKAQVARVVGKEGLSPKGSVTWEQTKRAAASIGLSPDRLARQTRLSGAEMLAIRNIVKANTEQVVELERTLATNPKLTDAERATMDSAINAADTQSDALLSRFVKERSRTGRDLNNMKILANATDDPVVWLARAKRQLGDAPLTDEIRSDVLRLLNAEDPDALAQYMANLKPNTTWQKAVTFWKAGLLTNPTTHMANFIGNTAMWGLERAKDVPAVVLDRVLGLATGFTTKSISVRGMARAAAEGAKRGVAEAGKVMRGEMAADLIRFNTYEVDFKNPVLNAYTHTVFRSLSAADKIFRELALRQAIDEQARVGANLEGWTGKAFDQRADALRANPTDEMALHAIEAADYATFQDNSFLAKAGSAVRRGFGKAGDVILPFTRTPANVAQRAFEYTPAGALLSINDLTALLKGAGTPEAQRRVVEQMGRSTIGAAALYAGYELASRGVWSGARPSEAAEREEKSIEGQPDNAVRIGKRWYSLNRVSPLGNLLSVGGSLYELSHAPDATGLGVLVGGVAALGKSVADQTFLAGLSGALDAVRDPVRYAGDFARQTVTSIIPAGVQAAVRATQGAQPDERGAKLSDVMRARVGASDLPVRRTALGDPVERRGVGELLDPFSSKPAKAMTDPVVAELAKVHGVVGPEGKLKASKQHKAETPAEYAQRSGREGKVLRGVLERLFQAPGYQAIKDDNLKRKEIDLIVQRARAAMTRARENR